MRFVGSWEVCDDISQINSPLRCTTQHGHDSPSRRAPSFATQQQPTESNSQAQDRQSVGGDCV